jgi:hypothetical protein
MTPFVAFDGPRRIAAGSKLDIARALKATGGAGALLAFDLRTGAAIDLDLGGSDAELAARCGESERGPGRPRLGVVGREVTLLPRHWEWLERQRGGASAALRRLVEAARTADQGATEEAEAKAAAFRFLSAMAGNFPGFEEAARALFAGDIAALRQLTSGWPADIVATALARLEAGAALSGPKGVC